VGIGLSAAAMLFYWAVLNHRFYVLTEGQAFRSAAMPPSVLLEKIHKHHIRVVIDFRKSPESVEKEKKVLAQTGAYYAHIPSDQVPDPERIEAFLKILDNPENRPVLMHCTHGVGRAGLYSAVYRMEYDKWSNNRAIREARRLSGFGSFQKGSSKEMFLRNYVPRWKRPLTTK